MTTNKRYLDRFARSAARASACVSASAILLTACARDVSIRSANPSDTLRDQLQTRLTSNRLSNFTLLALDLLDLRDQARRDQQATIAALQELADSEPDAPWRLAAAELLLDAAESESPQNAASYLACAYEADLEIRRAIARDGGLLDERTEFAADIYHRAVSRFLSLSNQQWLATGAEERLETPKREYRITLRSSSDQRLYGPDVFDSLRPTDLIRIKGMRSHHRLDAYGAPVIAIREQESADPPRAEPFIPPEGLIVPITVTLRFGSPTDAEVELWNPDHARSIERHNASLRLSTDTTAPIAALFARAELASTGRTGLLNVQDYVDRIGIYLHEPYDPSKIPVLCVHGLLSSPATWRDTLNDLRADPEIRERFQFWMFYYPTGMPIPRSAAYLRRELAEIRTTFDTTDQPMPDMILIGHSMGGLLSKAVTQSSSDTLWDSLHPEPIDSLEMTPYVREHLDEVFFYDADERIDRVIFIATPHRGSDFATSWIGRLGDALVDLPEEFDPIDDWFDAERSRLPRDPRYQLSRGIPSSIDDLRPDAPHLLAYLETPMREHIPFHLIAGNAKGDSDGIVPLTSALIDGAQSQQIVNAEHGAHTHPLAIREIRRILLEHDTR